MISKNESTDLGFKIDLSKNTAMIVATLKMGVN